MHATLEAARPSWLVRAALARPRTVLAAYGLLALAALPGLARLELRTDGGALVPPRDPAVAVDRAVRAHFGLRDPLIVLVEHDGSGGIWNATTLAKIRDLSSALAALPGIGADHVASLATQRGFRYDPFRGGFQRVLDPPPVTPAEVAERRAEAFDLDLPVGLLVAAGGEAAAIVVGVPEAGAASGDRTPLVAAVEAALRPFAGTGDRLSLVGAPAAEVLLGRHILADLGFLLPASIALLFAVFFLAFRRLAAVAVGALKIGISQLVVFGAMGWIGAPVYLTTAVLPVILVTVGLADEIHLLWRHRELLGRGESSRSAVERTFAELGWPVALTAFTTMTGFASFLTASIVPIAAFGLAAALGVGFCLLYSQTATPALLVLLPPGLLIAPRAGSAAEAGWAARFGAFVARRRGAVLVGLGLILAGAATGLPRLEVQDSWLDGFAEGSAFHRATERLDASFAGSHRLLLAVSFDGPGRREGRGTRHRGPLNDRSTLEALGELESRLAADPGVGGVVGPHRLLTTAAGIAAGAIVEARQLRSDPDGNGLLWAYYQQAAGVAARRAIVDDGFERAIVAVYLESANYRDTERVLALARALEQEWLAPLGGRIELAGDIALSQAMIPAIVRSQIGSLAGALLASALAVGLGLRSLRWGVAAVVPATAAVVGMLGAMGWAGVPLGVATSMFCALTLGIGDNYAIHFLERLRRARGEGESSPGRIAITATAPAIVYDALAIGAGFALLTVSQVPANRRLGFLVAAALGLAALFTLAGLGAAFLRDVSISRDHAL